MTSNGNRGSLLRKTLPKEEATRPRGMFRSSTEPLLSRAYSFLVGGSLLCATSVCCRPQEGFPVILSVLFFFIFSFCHHSQLCCLASYPTSIVLPLTPPSHSTLWRAPECGNRKPTMLSVQGSFLLHPKAISCYVLVRLQPHFNCL